MKPTVFIGTLSRDGDVSKWYAASLAASAVDLAQHGISCFPALLDTANVINGRNELIAQMRKTPSTHILFVDSDMSWPADAIRRLLTHEKPIVGGVYRKKVESSQHVNDWVVKLADTPISTELFKVAAIGTGFMLISKEVIERMSQSTIYYDLDGLKVYMFFTQAVRNGKLIGNDYEFCNIWRSMGGEVWADFGIQFGHYGRKNFTGHFHNVLYE